MKIRFLSQSLFAFACFYFRVVACALYEHAKYVEVFTNKETFDISVLQSDGVWLVQFCKNENEGCKKSETTFSKIGAVTKGFFRIAMVDMDSDGGKAIAADYSITKLPVYFTFSSESEPKKYSGSLEPQPILQTLMNEAVQTIQTRFGVPPSDGKKEQTTPSEDLVVEANESNYDELVLNNSDVVLVAFVAPWCGYCKKLEPEWTEAARRLEKEGVSIVKVDATAEKNLAGIYGVKGFPTIKYFPGGPNKSHNMAKDLPVEREAGSIVDFALKLVDETGVPKKIEELVSQEVLDKTCDGKNKICVLAALPHILDSGAAGRNKYLETLSAVQKTFRSGGAYQFLWFEGGNVQLEFEAALELTFGYPAIVAVSLERSAYSVLRGSFKEASISSFLNGVVTGRQRTVKMSSELPSVQTVEPWDGEDGAPIEEEEMSLDEIMGWDDDGNEDGGEL